MSDQTYWYRLTDTASPVVVRIVRGQADAFVDGAWRPAQNKVGLLYNGDMSGDLITEAEALEIIGATA